MNRYFALDVSSREANIYIFGDITSWEWYESDVSSFTLAKAIERLDVDMIKVHINSYGGEVAEGLAIYNTLKNHPATVKTICDGFACSAASVVFMAGSERVMSPASLLMIHNAWTYAAGNADDLRKEANDLEVISRTSANAYRSVISITDDELEEMLDAETWIPPDDALRMGFATSITEDVGSSKASQKARAFFMRTITARPPDAGDISARLDRIEALLAPPAPEPPPDAAPPPQEPTNKMYNLLQALAGGKE